MAESYHELIQKKLRVVTNDMPNKVKTLQKSRNVISVIKEHDTKGETELAISSVIYQEDEDFEDQIKEFSTKYENFCKGKGIHL